MAAFDPVADVGRFVPLSELSDKLHGLAAELIGNPQDSAFSLPLHGRRNRTPREAWHAVLFARAYECYFQLPDMQVWIEPVENSAHDAILQWRQNGHARELKVQLKELPSEAQNKKITLQGLIDKKAKSPAAATDIALVFFLGRNLPATTIKIPDHQWAGIWICGFTGDGKAEFISLFGTDEKGQHCNIRPNALPNKGQATVRTNPSRFHPKGTDPRGSC